MRGRVGGGVARRDDRTEPTPQHPDPRIPLPTMLHDLLPDMFSLPIAIGPNQEQVVIPGLSNEIGDDAFHLLLSPNK